jgi:hypothetical protein
MDLCGSALAPPAKRHSLRRHPAPELTPVLAKRSRGLPVGYERIRHDPQRWIAGFSHFKNIIPEKTHFRQRETGPAPALWPIDFLSIAPRPLLYARPVEMAAASGLACPGPAGSIPASIGPELVNGAERLRNFRTLFPLNAFEGKAWQRITDRVRRCCVRRRQS